MKTFKIKYMLMLLTLLFGAMPAASAANRFYVETASIKPGETKQLSFILENSQEFFGFQTDIELPAGLTFVTSDGKADITLSSRAEGGSYNMVSNLLSENKVRLGAFSASHTAFSGNDGVLLYAMVSACEDFSSGTVSLTNVRFTNSEDHDVKLPDLSTKILAYTPAESITLSQTTAQLKAGESVSLTATVLPETATDKNVTWKSSNTNVATVDANGKATAIAVGEATITASCGNATATCNVNVIATPAESITLSQTTAQLKAGESVTLTATVLPETTTDKNVTWASSNTNVATVDTDGKVTAIAVGKTTITATAADGSGVSAACQVSVNPIMVETLTISPDTWNGSESESFQITAVVAPENATNKTVTWSSSDETVATVNATGYVNVLKGGNCIITASTQDGSGLSAECIITCVSGIDDIFTDADAKFDVYNIQGVMVKKDCSRDDLKRLTTGAYILRQGNVNKKIIIR